MPCTSRRIEGQTAKQREDQVKTALKRLERFLASQQVTLVVDRVTGAVAFKGWTQREDVTDVCAFRVLQAEGSSALRMALARAEGLAGRKVDMKAVIGGMHPHDGGQTWSRH